MLHGLSLPGTHMDIYRDNFIAIEIDDVSWRWSASVLFPVFEFVAASCFSCFKYFHTNLTPAILNLVANSVVRNAGVNRKPHLTTFFYDFLD